MYGTYVLRSLNPIVVSGEFLHRKSNLLKSMLGRLFRDFDEDDEECHCDLKIFLDFSRKRSNFELIIEKCSNIGGFNDER